MKRMLKIFLLSLLSLTCSLHLHAQDENDATIENLEPVEEIKDTDYSDDEYLDEVSDTTYDETSDGRVAVKSDYDEEEADDSMVYEEDTIVVQRVVSDEDWQKVLQDSDYTYAYVKKATKPMPNNPPRNLAWLDLIFILLKYFFILVGIGIVIFIIYSVFKNNLFFNLTKIKNTEVDQEISYEQVKEFDAWETAIQDALRNEDYRLAMRLHYLQSLQNLDKRNLIKYHHEKTNWTYVNELRNKSPYNAFKNLTTYFDYIWYGKFELSKEKYDTLKEEFSLLNRSIV